MNLQNISYIKLIDSVEEKILAGEEILRLETELLLATPDEFLLHLLAAADRIRITFKGRQFDSCSLINARSGRCGEDCSFLRSIGPPRCRLRDIRAPFHG